MSMLPLLRPVWLIALPLALLLTACQSASGPGGGGQAAGGGNGDLKPGGIAIFAQRTDPPANWDPGFTSGIDLHHLAIGVFGDGNMVRHCREDQYRVCPNLGEKWASNADFTQWTFPLRDGMFWHDGQQLTPEDVKYSLELAAKGITVGDKVRPAWANSATSEIERVDVNGKDVTIVLKRPTPYFLDLLADGRVNISYPKHLFEPKIQAGDVRVGPADVGYVGIGPYKLAKYDKGSVVQVRRFDKYWEKDDQGRPMPYLDGIDFPIITDVNAMVAAFRTGQLDGGARGTGFGMLPEQRKAITQTMGDRATFVEIAGYRWGIGFNVLKEGPWDNVKVRQAMALWLDKRAGIQAVLGGQSFVHTLMDPRSPWPNPDFMQWPGFDENTRDKDKAEAKRLMAEAGFPNGFQMDFFCRQQWVQICEWFQGAYQPLGVNMRLDLVDTTTWTDRHRRGDFNAHIRIISETVPESLQSIFGERGLANNGAIRHNDPKMEEFFSRFRTVKSDDERVKVYRDLERYTLVDQVYFIPLFDELLAIPYRSYVKGLMPGKEDINHNLDFATVWLDK